MEQNSLEIIQETKFSYSLTALRLNPLKLHFYETIISLTIEAVYLISSILNSILFLKSILFFFHRNFGSVRRTLNIIEEGKFGLIAVDAPLILRVTACNGALK